MRSILTLLAVVAMAGCASEAPSTATTASATPTAKSASGAVVAKQICHKETVVGTQFPQTVCTNGDADPNDPNVQRNIDAYNRTNGFGAALMGRANGH